MKTFTRVIVVALFSTTPQGALATDALFEDDAILRIEIEGPMRELIRKCTKKPEFPALLRYMDSDGVEHQIAITLTSRGN